MSRPGRARRLGNHAGSSSVGGAEGGGGYWKRRIMWPPEGVHVDEGTRTKGSSNPTVFHVTSLQTNPAACSARLSFGVGVENNGMKAPLTTQNVDCSYDIRRGAIPERILFNIWTLDLREWLGGSDSKMALLPFLDIYRRGKIPTFLSSFHLQQRR